jgi:hypothetical protein
MLWLIIILLPHEEDKKGDTLPRNALLESPTSVSLIKKLIIKWLIALGRKVLEEQITNINSGWDEFL